MKHIAYIGIHKLILFCKMYSSKNLCYMSSRYYDLGLRKFRYHLVTVIKDTV